MPLLKCGVNISLHEYSYSITQLSKNRIYWSSSARTKYSEEKACANKIVWESKQVVPDQTAFKD